MAALAAGRIDTLQEGLQVDPDRIAQALQLFRDWAERKGLQPHEAVYVARTPERPVLRFTHDGKTAVEAQFRTHWISRCPNRLGPLAGHDRAGTMRGNG